MYFCYFIIISPWKRAGLFIWTNLNPLNPRTLWAKFGWNWPSGSGEEDENMKSLRQRQRRQRRRTINGQILIRKGHLSLRLRWAKNRWINQLSHFPRIQNTPTQHQKLDKLTKSTRKGNFCITGKPRDICYNRTVGNGLI